MYAIGDIIFGINLTTDSDVAKVFPGFEGDELDEFLESGEIETSYSGNGDQPRYFGIDMSQIDECDNERGSDIIARFQVTTQVKADWDKKLADFLANEEWSQELRDKIKACEPDVWLLWGSS
jgi:hypothetical protein